jgi:hypothetical protein
MWNKKAIDIDKPDLARANEIHRLAVETLGDTDLVRYGRHPRRTLVYLAVQPIDTVKVGKVEIRGCGAQLVAFGIHPVTLRPYYWPEGSPTDTDLQSLPAIEKHGVGRFIQRVQELSCARQGEKTARRGGCATGPSPTHSAQSGPAKPDHQGFESRIVRDGNNRVIDGREAYLAQLTWEEYHKGHRDVNVLASRVWMRFKSTADLTRLKGNSYRDRYQLKDALTKAKQIVRKAPPTRQKRKIRPVQGSHLHSMGKPGYWTFERKQDHQAEVSIRGLAPSRLAVNQAMLDATPIETGQCSATVAELMGTTGLSVSAVKSSRRDLSRRGLWIVERSVYIPSVIDALVGLEGEDRVAQAA